MLRIRLFVLDCMSPTAPLGRESRFFSRNPSLVYTTYTERTHMHTRTHAHTHARTHTSSVVNSKGTKSALHMIAAHITPHVAQ